jgi:hypothetical protein
VGEDWEVEGEGRVIGGSCCGAGVVWCAGIGFREIPCGAVVVHLGGGLGGLPVGGRADCDLEGGGWVVMV